MKVITLDKPLASEEEYFVFEEKSELKHEYINGTLFEMSGASKYHNKLKRKLANLIELMLGGEGFEVYDEGFKVRTPDGNFLYPDVMVCVAGSQRYYTDEPVLLIEILSDSTRRFDLSDKFIQYIKCPSLKYYLCVEPEKKVIYFYHQAENNEWVVEEAFTEDNAVINLPVLNMALQVKDIYNT